MAATKKSCSHCYICLFGSFLSYLYHHIARHAPERLGIEDSERQQLSATASKEVPRTSTLKKWSARDDRDNAEDS